MGNSLLEDNQYLRNKFSCLVKFDETQLVKWITFLLCFHDLGKFADSFQNLRPDLLHHLKGSESRRVYKLRHDTLGLIAWRKVLRTKFQENGIIPNTSGSKWQQSVELPIDIWIEAMFGHHGEPLKLNTNCVFSDYFDPVDESAMINFLSDLIALFVGEEFRFPDCDLHSTQVASWWLSGLAVLCDWLGSNTEFFEYQTRVMDLGEYWNIAQKKAKNAVQETSLFSNFPSSNLALKDLISSDGSKEPIPTHLQKVVSTSEITDSPHLFILEDVTGTGKTEAAFLLAHQLMQAGHGNGLYFALPTMATANSMYARMKTTYCKLFAGDLPSLVLAHSAREFSEDFRSSLIPSSKVVAGDYKDGLTPAEAHCNSWLADNRKKSLLADIGIGTIDQVLLGILPVRHQSLRLLGLITKILIVDEIHACDPYMHELLCALLRAHASIGGSAILLSATLSQSQRLSLINAYAQGRGWENLQLTQLCRAFPLISKFNEDGLEESRLCPGKNSKKEIQINLLFEISSVESVFINAIENNQCVCWIRNTVKDAVEFYQELRKKYPGWKIELFHARFALGDRLEIEKKIIECFDKNSTAESRQGRLLIATQVVEQSLDLDFDTLVTDLAPIDLIIQRAGRLRRHSRDKLGNRVAGSDRRGSVELYIYSPTIHEEPNADWYKNLFPNAEKVYCNHGQLWLTASLLEEKGKIKIPEDTRYLIEGVYSDEAQKTIPDSLLEQSIEAEGADYAEAGIARINALKIEAGYNNVMDNIWWSEGDTPTRLGERTKLVYLARWENNQPLPWISDVSDIQLAWNLSAVSVRTYWIDRECDLSELILQCKESLPAKGKWGVLLPLKRTNEGVWRGTALNERGHTIKCEYSAQFGLSTKL